MDEFKQLINDLDWEELAGLYRLAGKGHFKAVAAVVIQKSDNLKLCTSVCDSACEQTCWMKRNGVSWAQILKTIEGVFRTRCDTQIRAHHSDMDQTFNRMLRTIINRIPGAVAILDDEGVIVTVNHEWIRFALENGYDIAADTMLCGVGRNYLSICRETDDENAQKVAQLIDAILDGGALAGSVIYPCHSPTEARWFEVHLQPLVEKDKRFLLMQHVDVSDAVLQPVHAPIAVKWH